MTKRLGRGWSPRWSASRWRDLAWGLWLTPTILLSPLLLPLLEPSSIPEVLASRWRLYLLCFGLPFLLGGLCWRRATRIRDRTVADR